MARRVPSPSPVNSQVPPTRRSKRQCVFFMPCGPNHSANCSGSVQAANTRAGAASKVWRHDQRAVVRNGACDHRSFPSIGAFRCRALEIGFELVELLLPEAAIFLDPVGGGAQALAAQFAAPPLRLGVTLDQAGIGQHFQMPRHRRQRHVERLGDLAHRGRARGEPARMARRVGSASAEKVWESVSIFNILVKYKNTPRQVITRDVIAGSRLEPYESAPHVRS